jgi:hypothetical protein
MTRPQRLYAAALTLGILGLTLYATEHEELGMAGIVIAAVVGFIGWRVKG